MANETTLTTLNDVVRTAIEDQIKSELGARVVIAPLVRAKNMAGEGGHAWLVPKWTALTTGVAAVAEATDLANEAVSTGGVTITASEAGVMTTVTDKLVVGNVVGEDTIVQIGQLFGRSGARYVDTTIAALFTNLNGGTAVGTTTVNMTEDNFLDAIFTVENADAVGPKVCVLHSRQLGDLRSDMFINAVTTSGGLPGHTATIDHNDFGFSDDDSGFWTTLYGVPIFMSNLCPLVNTSADRAGALFIAGSTIGMAYHWLNRIEFQRDASLRATEVVLTLDVGFGEIEDAEGVPIETDA